MKPITILFIFLNTIAFSQTPTWSDKVAKIIYNNCTECHRSGSIATFPLLTYSDAKAYAFGIKYATSTGTMPPWHADPSYNHLKGERILSAQEKQDISDWVDGGAPSGDLSQAPAPPVFPTGIKMQNPDKSIAIPVYAVTKNTDDYRNFTIPSGLSADKFLSQIEFDPQNLSIVHHILLFQDNAQTCKTLDDNDPLPGYSGTGGGIGSSSATLIGGWVPGGSLLDIPTGMGIRVKANAYYILQIHYAPGSMTKKDSTKCFFKYSTLTSPREVYVSSILHHVNAVNGGLTNGPLYIPANTTKTFNQRYDMDNTFDYSVISVAPHMHMIGKSYKVFAVTPTNDTLKLCYLPNWDFRWQGAYTFRKIVKFPKSSKIYGEASYDNTSNNVFNPSSPPKNVYLGENTTDEMMLCYFSYTLYYPGDENIILDSAILKTGIENPSSAEQNSIHVFPNPAENILNIDLDNSINTLIVIVDMNGKILDKINTSNTHNRIDISNYPKSVYLLRVEQRDKISLHRFLKI
jgi:hypothetical protein